MEQRRRRSSAAGILLVILLICAAASLAVLFGRLSEFNADGFENVIPLTRSQGGTKMTVSRSDKPLQSPALESADTASQPGGSSQQPNNGSASFTAYDENTVWSTETEVDIFKFTYDETGSVTVRSNPGSEDKLVAPGTSNEYTFTLENTGDFPLDYTMCMEAWFGTEYAIPVTAAVRDYNGNYLLGSEQDRKDVLELNNVSDSGVLGAGRCQVYTLDWEWAFERGEDELDTMLGDLAADEDITLTIKILTTAAADNDPDSNSDKGLEDPSDKNGGTHLDIINPSTGSLTPFGKATLFMLIGAAAIFAVRLFGFRQKDDEQEDGS